MTADLDRQVRAMAGAFAAHERSHHGIETPDPIPDGCLRDVLVRYMLRLVVPDDIPPGLNPGGLIVHVYTPSGDVLVAAPLLPDPDTLTLQALAHESQVRDDPRSQDGVVLALFDGDTGSPWSMLFLGGPDDR